MSNKAELLARAELGTYLEGLADALVMSKPEIRKAIKIIIGVDDEQ